MNVASRDQKETQPDQQTTVFINLHPVLKQFTSNLWELLEIKNADLEMYVKSWARTQSESYTVSDMESCGLADWRHGLSFVPRLIIARWFYKQCLLPGPVEPKTVAGKRKSGLSEWRARKKNISLSFYQTTKVSGSAASISCVSTIWFIYLTLTQWWKPGKFFFQEWMKLKLKQK